MQQGSFLFLFVFCPFPEYPFGEKRGGAQEVPIFPDPDDEFCQPSSLFGSLVCSAINADTARSELRTTTHIHQLSCSVPCLCADLSGALTMRRLRSHTDLENASQLLRVTQHV